VRPDHTARPLPEQRRYGEEAFVAQLVLSELGKVYADGTRAVRDLSLEVRDGEFVVLVGPSGCGKTTALRMIAGLEPATTGTIQIGDRVVNQIPARDRDVAMVFQSYALYPHLNVYENIAFSLRVRDIPKADIDRRVREVATTLDLNEQLRNVNAIFDRVFGAELVVGAGVGVAVPDELGAFADRVAAAVETELSVMARADIAIRHMVLIPGATSNGVSYFT